jgi:hypothetical protein
MNRHWSDIWSTTKVDSWSLPVRLAIGEGQELRLPVVKTFPFALIQLPVQNGSGRCERVLQVKISGGPYRHFAGLRLA